MFANTSWYRRGGGTVVVVVPQGIFPLPAPFGQRKRRRSLRQEGEPRQVLSLSLSLRPPPRRRSEVFPPLSAHGRSLRARRRRSWRRRSAEEEEGSPASIMASAASASPASPAPPGADGTCDEGGREMHSKMCKKIAQLTKVIYALNTKHDEHEASIQALKEAHQEEIQYILAETRETVLQYKSKVEEAQELQKHIHTLEETLEKHRRIRKEASSEFAKCAKLIEERKSSVETKQADDKILFPRVTAHMKLDCENTVEASKDSDSLMGNHWTYLGDPLDNSGKVTATCSMDMNETMNFKWEKQKLAEEYTEMASHEREKETWRKAMQQSVPDLLREWQQREMEQREIYEAGESISQQQLEKLEADLEAKGQRINDLKKYSQKLKEKMQDLEIQLKEAQQETMEYKNIRKSLEEELVTAKERLLLQENEIQNKTEAMETALNSHSKVKSEVDELKKHILMYHQALSAKQSEVNQDGGDSQPKESAEFEKVATKQQHKADLRKIKQESDEEKSRLKEQLVKGLEDLVKKHTLEIKSVRASMDTERKKLQKEVQIQLEELKKKYENETRQLQKEKETINGKLQECSLEALRLETFIRQNRDIPKCAEFLKSHARKSRERQQELQDAFAQQKDVSKHQKERAKGKEHSSAPTSNRNEEKPRLDSGGAPKREDRQTLTSFQKEKSKEMQALQEEWYYQKAELQAQVTELKQTLEQQTNAFREALRQQELQSSRDKEKLLQDLQDTIKQSQDTKVQLEASHQRAINLLEKSKNQEFKEAEEYWKRECNDRFKMQQQSHQLEVQALEKKTREELQIEFERIQNQQTLLIESLKMELSEQQISCMTHSKEKEELQGELKNTVAAKRQQEASYQNQIKSLKDELEKCQNEISGLKKENSLLKDTMDLLSVDVERQKQTSTQLQDRENQQRRLLEEDLKVKHKKDLDILKEDHHQEMKNMMSEFSNSQALLHAKIVSLENELKELEEKPRKREPRLEDRHLIDCLQDKLNEKEEMIKELMQKKNMDDAPSRIVSVPNLASYAKSFLTGDLRPKRNSPQITKSTSLDRNPGCVRVCYPSVQALEIKPAPRLQNTEISTPKDAEKPDPRHQEWFTKYFSF
uniref:Family with sequence similarity 184 member B n=1 Tax=Anolis carolinensis TaxID=28377 RepID=A0A803TKI5_ANOCA|nr:PREDICTED: protein FAM184B isoform X3 [Anolis carolinensis]|eukprot:XP_008109509.2 PREDICTED: protein FAM184B isoform X3 [Anolis carolinensis]